MKALSFIGLGLLLASPLLALPGDLEIRAEQSQCYVVHIISTEVTDLR